MAAKPSFENGIIELENIVNKLESGEVTLEESFKLYQKGVSLYKSLKSMLDDGDARISVLTADAERDLIETEEQ